MEMWDKITRLPGHDIGRLDLHNIVPRQVAGHQPVEQSGGFVSGLFRIQGDAGQRRNRRLAHQFVIVHAHHGHVVRHVQFGGRTGLRHFASTTIVAGHYAYGFWQ